VSIALVTTSVVNFGVVVVVIMVLRWFPYGESVEQAGGLSNFFLVLFAEFFSPCVDMIDKRFEATSRGE
jgi:hypothetical protein